jgi:hypothetical protein
VRRSRYVCLLTALVLTSAGCGVLAPGASAATREPLSQALAATRRPVPAYGSSARPNRTAALRAMAQSSVQRYEAAGNEFKILSAHYEGAAVESVAATLRALDHGPEMAELTVFVATPEEISGICGATVVACYIPSSKEMVVSGVDQPVDGVPRDFAIAHEYGHHIANSREGSGPYPPIEAGTIRWATYERVCQLTRAHRLFPGNQGAHYWQDPEEAFAQSYAHLSRPTDNVSWQYTPLLQPSMAALEKIHADVTHPWSGPVSTSWSDSVAAPPSHPSPRSRRAATRGGVGVAGAKIVGPVPWVAERRIRTPLDGTVSVSVQAPEGSSYAVTLRDPDSGRVLARSEAAAGPAELSYSNCGHDDLLLEVRSTGGAGDFQASITRP